MFGSETTRWRNWLLVIMASFAFIWIVHRAIVQSITLDEADTFLRWVAPDPPAYWEPHSNNHVLNSMLMRVSIGLFGLSPLTMRMPALLGGLLYIFAMYRLCVLLTGGLALASALFACLVYNPFIMDYLVAARGYGLALGFLGLAIMLVAQLLIRREAQPNEREILSHIAAISACIGLSICANFSFAFANGFLMLAAGSLALLSIKFGIRACVRLALAASLPALLIVLILAGSALLQMPRDQLFWGARSFSESYIEMRRSIFSGLNPFLVNSFLANLLRPFERHAAAWFTLPAVGYLVLLFVRRRQPRDPAARARLEVAASLTSVLLLAVSAHWLQFKLLKIPLPMERTGLWMVPFFMVAVGAVLSVPPSDWMQRAVRTVGVACLVITGFYFAGELRDSYFLEWKIDAEVKDAFPVVLDLCSRAGVNEIPSGFNLTSVLNVYSVLYKVTDRFHSFEKMPSDRPVYVLEESVSKKFIQAEGLEVVWRGTISGVVVAIRPNTPGLTSWKGAL